MRCKTPRIREEELKAAFMLAFNMILGDKERYIAQFEELLPLLADTSAPEIKLTEAQDAHDAATDRMRRHIEGNAQKVQNQVEYERHFSEISEECEKTEKLVIKIKDEILEQSARKEQIRRYLNELRQTGSIVTEFDEDLWQTTVESVTVKRDKSFTFTFRDGSSIPVKPPKTKQRG
jgi:site-specific DNA recombinase